MFDNRLFLCNNMFKNTLKADDNIVLENCTSPKSLLRQILHHYLHEMCAVKEENRKLVHEVQVEAAYATHTIHKLVADIA